MALLLGRALDAQRLFNDVTYAHRLRDSVSELYQFRNKLITGGPRIRSMETHDYRPSYQAEPENDNAVNGVFTLLTDCYSPTCTRDKLCYSIACPRRLEQVLFFFFFPRLDETRSATFRCHVAVVSVFLY